MHQEGPLDPLERLLRDIEFPPMAQSQRDAIFAQTRGVLWRRRWRRRGTWGLAFVACYVIGVLTGRIWPLAANKQFAAQPVSPVILPVPGTPVPPNAVPDPTSHSAPPPVRQLPPTQSADVPPRAIAVVAPASNNATTFEKLRQAGDRQLNQMGNLQAAIGCYRRALDCATEVELKIVPERDSWLLIPLKEARLEARKHVSKKS